MRFLIPVFVSFFLLAGCGEEVEEEVTRLYSLEETGTIETGDMTDQNHSDLAYDPFEFPVEPLDVVTVSIEADGFNPMLKLIEVSTGAVLAEWDSQYSEEDCLTYTIAGGGACQARVYALDHETGNYTVSITVIAR